MSKKIDWAGNPNYRTSFYAALLHHVGPYNMITGKGRIGKPTVNQKLLLDIIASGMALLFGTPVSAGGAFGMQHRWCVSEEKLKNSTDGLSQFRSIFCNRVAAVQAGYLSYMHAVALFRINMRYLDERCIHWFDLALEGRISLDDAVRNAQEYVDMENEEVAA